MGYPMVLVQGRDSIDNDVAGINERLLLGSEVERSAMGRALDSASVW